MVKLPKPSMSMISKKDEDINKLSPALFKTSKVTKKAEKIMKIQNKFEKKIKTIKDLDKVKNANEETAKIQPIIKEIKKTTKALKNSNKRAKIIKKRITTFTSKNNIESKHASSTENEHRTNSSDAPRVLQNEVKFERTMTTNSKKRSSEKSKKKQRKILLKNIQTFESTSKTSQVVRNDIAKVGNLEITESHVRKCIQAVVKLTTKKKENEKKTLLPNDNSPIFLQVTCVKVPKTPRKQLRIFLPHMVISPTDEVALFVPDLEKGQRKNHEKTIDHWETILRNKNVTRIDEVIPMNRVKAEFSQYEMKLKLGRMFDYFLVDGRISGHMTHILGKTFKKSAQPPTPVKLQRDNLKSEIDNALRKTCMQIHGNGNCHTLRVGTIAMPEQEIVDNIIEAWQALKKHYPGGQENIRSIFIRSTKSLSIPIYFSMQNKNEVPVAKITAKRPKAFKTVEGELSTASGHVVVKLEPGGRIELQKISPKKQLSEAQENVL